MSSRLMTLAREAQADAQPPPEDAPERCDLCSEPVPAEHRHLADLSSRRLMCVCRACALLFDRDAAGGGHYRLLPERRLRLDGFRLSEALWDRLRIPVGMAFFFREGESGRVTAFYPSPMGATESLLELDAWSEIEAQNPVLADMAPDVEALLVDRSGDEPGHWLVPLDDCYELVGLIRTRWRGLGGGAEVWRGIEEFFARLDRQAKRAPAVGAGPEKEAR
jgi:hypothetical protein